MPLGEAEGGIAKYNAISEIRSRHGSGTWSGARDERRRLGAIRRKNASGVLYERTSEGTVPTGGDAFTGAEGVAASAEGRTTGKRSKRGWVAFLLVLTLAGISIAAATAADAATRAKAPVARDDLYTVEEDVPLTVAAPGVLLNDKANGGKLTVKSFSTPVHGDLVLSRNGSFVYTPDENYAGEDSFTYTARNKWRKTDKATVRITVNPVNDAPRITAPTTLSVDETPAALTGIGVADVDAGAGATTLTFSVGSESLAATSG
jgi:VCBS repeat-containing protein